MSSESGRFPRGTSGKSRDGELPTVLILSSGVILEAQIQVGLQACKRERLIHGSSITRDLTYSRSPIRLVKLSPLSLKWIVIMGIAAGMGRFLPLK